MKNLLFFAYELAIFIRYSSQPAILYKIEVMLLKKVDKLVVVPFLGLLLLIACVAIFIILMQFFLIFFDELIGKGLGMKMYLQLFLYFGVAATPKAFPIATLVASLMSFGNLGESLELTALKSAGTSLLRILLPLILLVSLLSVLLFFSNGYLVPKITMKGYSLLYDLRKKKPSVAIREGVFYTGVPDYSLRVEKKLPDEKTLLDVIIYDHSKKQGNISLTTAEYGELYTIDNERYLVVELYNGHNYLEQPIEEQAEPDKGTPPNPIPSFYRTTFKKQKLLLDLDEFKLTRTNKDLFSYHYTTKTNRELALEISEQRAKLHTAKQALLQDSHNYSPWLMEEKVNKQVDDSQAAVPTQTPEARLEGLATEAGVPLLAQVQLIANVEIDPPEALLPNPHRYAYQVIQQALATAKDYRNQLQEHLTTIRHESKSLREYKVEQHQRMASALACLIMLLIGAPLGVLIRKGGLGVPLLISTVFILLYYITDMLGTRWAKLGLVDSTLGAWAPNLALLPFGIFFLRQAQKDSRLLDIDAYRIWIARYTQYFKRKK
jgi:lipopolysaccharide export system permease protein